MFFIWKLDINSQKKEILWVWGYNNKGKCLCWGFYKNSHKKGRKK
jgi:hypothetical protein